MKYIFLFILATLSAPLFAQQKQFAKGDDGKYIFYKVVDSQKVNRNILVARANVFAKANQKLLKVTAQTDSSIAATGKLIIDKTVLVVGHPSGELKYKLNFEARDAKYRYWLTDFAFIPYQRDRYGNFVPTTNIGTPLEKKVDKLTAAQWRDIQESAYLKTVKFAQNFQSHLATATTTNTENKAPAAVSTKKW